MEECTESIVLYIKRRAPGVLEFLDLVAQSAFSKGIMSLFSESPSRVYFLILSYVNNEDSADAAFKLLFLNSLVNCLEKRSIRVDLDTLLRLVKLGNDEEFKRIVGGASACRDSA